MDNRCQSQQTTTRFRIVWLLRLTIAIQAIGIASQFLLTEFETESPLFSYLLYERQWPQETAQQLDNAGVLLWLAAGLAVVFVPLLDVMFRRTAREPQDGAAASRWGISLELLLLAFILLVQVVHVTATWHRGTGELYNEWVPLARIARWMTPVLLVMLLPIAGHPISSRRFDWAMWLLRLTAAITFIAHGYKAIMGYSPFVDYLLVAANQFLGWDASEATMTVVLAVIGWVDVVFALLLLTRRWRTIAIYMAIWAFIGAAARVVHSGLPSGFEVAIRSGNYCLPLAVALYFQYAHSAQDPSTARTTGFPRDRLPEETGNRDKSS